MIHERSKRLDALWRYDPSVANADGHPDLQAFWRDLKAQEQGNFDRLKQLVAQEVQKNCF